jgi:PEGA domain
MVAIDGVTRGSTPVTVNNLAVGDHNVTVVRNGTTYRRTIRVDAAATASLVITNRTSAGPESGWFSVTAAVPLQIFEDGKLVGSTESERILVPAGDHAFDFTNTALGFRESRDVKIAAGVDKQLAIDLPEAAVSINATPWAQVWLDGRALGETPIGDLTTRIGSHELVFRHPQFGERRVTTVVTTREPARIAVDMRRSQ